MSKDNTKALEWSLYWSQNNLHSCVANIDNVTANEDQLRLEAVWIELAQSLTDNARVLDLATGNGAVPSAMLREKPNLTIEAVDKADIDPTRYLTEHAELESVIFHANQDINKLEFSPESFDAISSQFGIEYAGLHSAVKNVHPLLKSKGFLSLIVHHTDSEIIKSSKTKIKELAELLKEGGLMETFLKYIRGEIDYSLLENKGIEYQQNDSLKTEQISGQVFAGIERVMTALVENANNKKVSSHNVAGLAAGLSLRVNSEHLRLLQMVDAAQSEESMNSLLEQLKEFGYANLNLDTLTVISPDESDDSSYLLAWHLSATK